MSGKSPQRRPYQFSLASLMVLVTLASLCTCGVRVFSRHIHLQGVTPAEANLALSETRSPPMVPLQATNVDVNARFQSGDASFDISREDLKTWCRSRDWPLLRIITPRGVVQGLEVSSYPAHCPLNLTDISYFTNSSHRGGWTLVYDHSSGRAWIQYSAH